MTEKPFVWIERDSEHPYGHFHNVKILWSHVKKKKKKYNNEKEITVCPLVIQSRGIKWPCDSQTPYMDSS